MHLEFLELFVNESREMISEVEPILIEILENAKKSGEIDSDSLNMVFRLFHSMKGSAGSLELNNLASLTHKAETLLDIFREKKAEMNSEHLDVFLRTLDLAALFLDQIEEFNNDDAYESEKQTLVEELSDAIDIAKGKKKKQKSQVEEQTTGQNAQQVVDTPKNGILEQTGDLINKEIAQQFSEESLELLDECESALLEIEQSPDQTENYLKKLYREFHSFKGNCGFLGLQEMEKLSHRVENALDAVISDNYNISSQQIMTLLMIVDTLREGVDNYKTTQKGTVEGLDTMLDIVDQSIPPQPAKLGELLLNEGKVTKEVLDEALKKQEELRTVSKKGEKTENSDVIQKKLEAVSKKQIRRSDIRVDLSKLDQLVNLIGELVIAETMVTKNPDLKGLSLENFEKSAHHLRRVASSLQDVAMNIRMIPLSSTFQKLVRVVYDIAKKNKKQVKLNLVGEETEIDKTMTEQLADPLLHMVRSSVDHGIESPERRKELGKPDEGNVTIEARYEGGEVWIIVSDDGAGLDRDVILKKALDKKLIPANRDFNSFKDTEVFNMIFEPGFSTAASVSEISGRGVGMDVVKKNIEKLKGRITVTSEINKGTTVFLQIPLTLAIIDGMLVRVGNSKYTVPLLSIKESLQPEKSAITKSPDGQEIVRIREDLIPILRIYQLHNKTPDYTNLHEGILVIIEERSKKIALFVDEILGQQQTVVKGLSKYFSDVKGVSGCTILGDGAVSLILDISGLIDKAGSKYHEYNS